MHFKKLIVFLLLLNITFLFSNINSDVKTKIEKKEYQEAFEMSEKSLKQNFSASLLYNNCLAAAGLNLNGMLDETMLNSTNDKYSGKKIMTPNYMISSGDCNTNCFLFMKENPTQIYMVKTFPDKSGKPAIVMMVYVTLKNPMTKSEYNKLNKKKCQNIR
jgi:hypothetical protein